VQSDFWPFGIQNLDGSIYVTYAKQDDAKHDDVAGIGFGFVNVFDANGCLLKRLARRGQLNASWGLAIAPADFGRFSNTLLIGNFGDGRINAFDIASGNFRGQLSTNNGEPLSIDGLWRLLFGNDLTTSEQMRFSLRRAQMRNLTVFRRNRRSVMDSVQEQDQSSDHCSCSIK
jgi:uncharacterized protein (TIGR03118 family)